MRKPYSRQERWTIMHHTKQAQLTILAFLSTFLKPCPVGVLKAKSLICLNIHLVDVYFKIQFLKFSSETYLWRL